MRPRLTVSCQVPYRNKNLRSRESIVEGSASTSNAVNEPVPTDMAVEPRIVSGV